MTNFSKLVLSLSLVSTMAVGCAGGSLTTREKGAGIGALAGLGGSALYTYKLRNRTRRY